MDKSGRCFIILKTNCSGEMPLHASSAVLKVDLERELLLRSMQLEDLHFMAIRAGKLLH